MKRVGDYVTKSEHIQTITAGVLLTVCGTSGVWVGGYGLSADYVSTKGYIILISIVLLALYAWVANRAFVLLDNLKAKYGPNVFE